MNTFFKTLLILCVSSLALADDTEIYGAAEIDLDKRVNSNVLFVMDTSGSMGGTVAITHNDYVNTTNYSGSYNTSEFYYSTSHSPSDGINTSSFSSNSSYDCAHSTTTLSTEGRVLGNFQQYRNGRWRNLSRGSNSTVRCDKGNTYWLYSGNYMNWYHDSSNVTTSTRMDVTVDVVKNLTNSLTNINLGLMRFDQDSQGGLIDVPVSDVTTSGALIRTKLDAYYPQGGTPLEESMHEAAKYYRGEEWLYGKNSDPNVSVLTSRTTTDSSKYKTPITATCQKNHIILLTDGEPTGDTNSNTTIKGLVNDLTLPAGLSSTCSGNGDCMDELAYWLQNTDQADSVAGSQAVTTYTIGGFDLANGVELLKRTAKWGGGQYYEANDTAGLTDALESIFLEILSTDSTFTAPAVSVNAFNTSQHRDELFYALFRPNDNSKWDGNLKKYRLGNDGVVYDVNNASAISDSTGFFTDGAKDHWNDTDIADGKNVTLGGVANLLDPSQRSIYTNDSANALTSFTASVNAESLGMTDNTAEEVTKVISWTQGFDINDEDGDGDTTDSRFSIGDPLHSEPIVLTYGGSDSNPDSTIYFGTNEGFIHAINAESGEEVFSFIPNELHKNQKTYYQNTTAAGSRPYGMDGPITPWINDLNEDNVILSGDNSLQSNEHIYIYAGMRRGGRNYYAMDVSDRTNPGLLFTINGDEGDFEKLGQTWSAMTPAKVNWKGSEKVVLFFGGGYDTNQDGNTFKEDDDYGNAIYMVDAYTGERLWWASDSGADLNISDMTNSIPANLSVIDISGDGLIDYIFAADTGGRIIRIDLNPENSSASSFAKGGVIASLSVDGSSTAAKKGNRRFYSQPSVSLVKSKSTGDYLSIAIGSGHRAHPIYTTEVENRFYVIKDRNPYSAPDTYEIITEAPTNKVSLGTNEKPDATKLYNATSIMKGTEPTPDLNQLLAGGGGFYVTFDTTGEKVLTKALTFSGAVFFNTFAPSSGELDAESCGADTGQSTFYAINLADGSAALNLEGDGGSSQTLANSGIAPRPVVIFGGGGGSGGGGGGDSDDDDTARKTIAVGTETIEDCRFSPGGCGDDGDGDGDGGKCGEGDYCSVVPIYWRQNDNNYTN